MKVNRSTDEGNSNNPFRAADKAVVDDSRKSPLITASLDDRTIKMAKKVQRITREILRESQSAE